MSDRYERAVARLREGAVFAADKPDETPETTAQALWLAAAGTPCAVSRARLPLPVLSDMQAAAFGELLNRRLAGEPLAYLTGRQEFMGLEFLAEPGALIPRRETELVGTGALALARERAEAGAPVRILDLCTGAGNLAVALAVLEPRSDVWASDLEPPAVALAARNVALHDVADRVTLLQGDLFGALAQARPAPSPFDLIVCNPPYIPSHKARNMATEVGGFEPPAAFDGGDFGLSILFRLVSESPQHLVPGGWLCFELGAGQGRLIEKKLSGQGGYAEVRVVADQAGTARALLARRKA